jgi:hypothetical protein
VGNFLLMNTALQELSQGKVFSQTVLIYVICDEKLI